MMYKGFDSDSFIGWMEENFNIDCYGRSLLLNVIDYAHRHEHVSKDQFAYFIADMLPEVELQDVARFCDDAILTDETLKWCKRITYYIRCFERDLIIDLEHREVRSIAEAIVEKAYDNWCEQSDKIGDMCCEEYICQCLKDHEIEFAWVNE